MRTASIKINDNTRGHRATLESKGYEVTEVDGRYVVTIDGPVHEELVNLTTQEGREAVRQVIAQKGCFTYKTHWLLPGESRTHNGIFALRKLGILSAFVMRPEKKKPETSSLDKDLVDDLLG